MSGARRLLVVSSLYPPAVRGGYEVECETVVRHLAADHELCVLTSRAGHGAPQPPEARVLRTLPWTGDLRPRDAALAALQSAVGAREARRALAEVRPDAIYLWNGGGIPAAAVRALLESGLPVLVRVCEHWWGALGRADQLTRYLPGGERAAGGADGAHRLLGAVARGANHLPGLRVDLGRPVRAAVSWNAEFLRARSPSPPGVTEVHHDVNPPATPQIDRLLQLPRAPVPGRVLFVGRVDEQKGALTAVDALARVRAEHGVDAELVAVGRADAAGEAAMRRAAEEHGVAGHVRLTGPLRGAALDAEIAAASAWCVPSEWEEPAALVCVEAGAARVPAVISDAGGNAELLRPEREALFHRPGDADGLARALAASLRGGVEVEARVGRAHVRAGELATAPYLERTDRFLAEGLAALR